MDGEIDETRATSASNQPPAAPMAPERDAPDHNLAADRPSGERDPTENLDMDMVRRTRIVGAFTGLLFVASILQFCAMRGQLAEMKMAREGGDTSAAAQLKVATDASNAAAAANNIAIQALISSQRPYVIHRQSFGGAAFEVSPIITKGRLEAIIYRPYWANLGNTPTSDLKASLVNHCAISAPFDALMK